MDGMNVSDYVDPDIELKLREWEEEEAQQLAEMEAADMGGEDDSDLDEEEEAVVDEIRERKRTMRTSSMVNKSQNAPRMPRAIRGKKKDTHDRGALDEDEIKKRMGRFGVDPTAMLERGRATREADRGRKRDRSRARGEGDDVDMGGTTAAVVSGSEGEVTAKASTSVSSKARRKKIARAGSKSVRSASIARSRSHSRPRDPSSKGLRDESQAAVAEKKARKGLKKAVEISGRSGEGDHTQSVHLVKWMNTGKKRNGTHYCR